MLFAREINTYKEILSSIVADLIRERVNLDIELAYQR